MFPALVDVYNRIGHGIRDGPMLKALLPMMEGGDVLDFGCGDGCLSKKMAGMMKAERGLSASVQGVDVYVHPKPFIDVKKYDGKRLHFADSSFDCVLCVDVLHHTDDPAKALSEIARVSRGHIVLKDHVYGNRAELQLLKAVDWMSNRSHGVSLPYNFLNAKEWDSMFSDMGLLVIQRKTFRLRFFDPMRHFAVKLEKR